MKIHLLLLIFITSIMIYAAELPKREESKKEAVKKLEFQGSQQISQLEDLAQNELETIAQSLSNEDLYNLIKSSRVIAQKLNNEFERRKLGIYWATGKIITKELMVHSYFTTLALSPDGTRAAGSEGSSYVYLPSLVRSKKTYFRLTGNVFAVAFISDKSLLTLETDSPENNYVIRLRTIQGQEIQANILPIKISPNINCAHAAFSMNGKWLAIGFSDGFIRVFDVHRNQKIKFETPQFDRIDAVAISSDGTRLAASVISNDKGLEGLFIFDVKTGQKIRKMAQFAFSATFSPDDMILAVGMPGWPSQVIQLFDVQSGKTIRKINSTGILSALAFSADGRKLAVSFVSGKFNLFEALLQ